MKVAHNITVSVFVKEGEEIGQIRQSFLQMISLDLEKEKLKLKQTTAKGAENNKIEIIEIKLEKERHVNSFLDDLFSKFNDEQKELLTKQLDSRVDDECHFFIRLDKKRLLNKEYWVTDSGDCFHIKISIAAYPAKKENAIEAVKGLIES